MPEYDSSIEYRTWSHCVLYSIGNDGSVWSKYSGEWKRLKPGRMGKRRDYFFVTLCLGDGRRMQRYVHHLVLEVFKGQCPEGMEACHGDGNPRNNNADNLRWGTRESNNQDKIFHGTIPRGEKHWNTDLTAEAVATIRSDRALGKTLKSLSLIHGCSESTIWRICNRESWNHVS